MGPTEWWIVPTCLPCVTISIVTAGKHKPYHHAHQAFEGICLLIDLLLTHYAFFFGRNPTTLYIVSFCIVMKIELKW